MDNYDQVVNMSPYALDLEKSKVRFNYNITERQVAVMLFKLKNPTGSR
jgi:hypothetical protein